jgi:CRP/FNR family transcriptional regulator, cyclic AMP receptor protein
MVYASGDIFSTLSRVPLFSSLSPEELQSLADRMSKRSYNVDEVVFHKGDPGSTLHIITKGLVKISLLSEDGGEALLVLLMPGEFFGELTLFDGLPRSASAVVMEPTDILVLQREDFLGFVGHHPEAAMAVFAVICSRLRRADDIISDATFVDVPNRVLKKLKELAQSFSQELRGSNEIYIRLRQQELAGMVGASRESVNRALAHLEQQGIIRTDRQRIIILRPEVLLN